MTSARASQQIRAPLSHPVLHAYGHRLACAHTSQLCDADFATYRLQHWWRECGSSAYPSERQRSAGRRPESPGRALGPSREAH
jgi:hypothetical protein